MVCPEEVMSAWYPLFTQALGLPAPWQVTAVEFPSELQELHLHLDFPRGSRFPCPECEAVCPVYDTDADRIWRHLNFWQHPTFLHARLPRVACSQCGVRTVHVPWARPECGFTLLFEATVLTLAQQMPVAAAARVVGEHDTCLWRILAHYLEEAAARADWSEVRQLGLDETFCRPGPGKGEFLTLAVDLEAQRVLGTAPGRDSQAVETIGAAFSAHEGQTEAVEAVCLDLSGAYQHGVHTTFPQSTIVFDRFHVMQLVHDAVDAVRRAETKEHPELKRSRYLWLRAPEDLTAKQQARLEKLLALPLRTAWVYRWKRQFQQLWEQPDGEAGRRYFRACLDQCGLETPEAVVQLTETLDRHRRGILAYFQHRITNGLLEGLSSLIQATKAEARGFRTDRYFTWIILLLAGKLLPKPAT